MSQTVQIDIKLVSEAKLLGKHKTKKAAINEALREYIQQKKQLAITDLFGKMDFDESYSYKKMRS
jgi:hypothetical protein